MNKNKQKTMVMNKTKVVQHDQIRSQQPEFLIPIDSSRYHIIADDVIKLSKTWVFTGVLKHLSIMISFQPRYKWGLFCVSSEAIVILSQDDSSVWSLGSTRLIHHIVTGRILAWRSWLGLTTTPSSLPSNLTKICIFFSAH